MKNENNKLSWIDWLHEFDMDDDDKSYEHFVKHRKSPEELMKLFPPDQPIEIKEWGEEDFKSYYKAIKDKFGEDFAWKFVFAKIKQYAGEGNGALTVSSDEF